MGIGLVAAWLACAPACSEPEIAVRGGTGGSSGTTGVPYTVPPGAVLPDAGTLVGPPPAELLDKGCNKLDVSLTRTVPTVAVVVDRSSSMQTGYGAGTRWDVLKTSLLDPTNGLIKANEHDIRFGLFMFTSMASESQCPAIGRVDFAIDNFEKIRALYEPATTPKDKGETPTGETIEAVTAELLRVPETAPKYILLATDGEPDTCPGTCMGNDCPVSERPGWPRDPNCGHDRSLAAVQAAFAKGIKTYVLGIGDEIGGEHMQALANAGSGMPVVLGGRADWLRNSCRLPDSQWKGVYAATPGTNAKYYKPTDAASLAADLRSILDGVVTCSFMLKGKVDVSSADRGVVALDGQRLTYGDPNGWSLNGPSQLEIQGTACQMLLQAGKRLQVAFPCMVYIE